MPELQPEWEPGREAESDPEPVVVALGSNLGDRLDHLRAAVAALGHVLRIDRTSPVVESPAVDIPDEDAPPDFLNAVVVGRTDLSPGELLEVCHTIEGEAGRVRGGPPSSRTVDLDIVFFADRVISSPGLTVPHPRWRERGFVLLPLLETVPEWRDPASGETVEEVCRDRGHLLRGVRVVHSERALRPEGDPGDDARAPPEDGSDAGGHVRSAEVPGTGIEGIEERSEER